MKKRFILSVSILVILLMALMGCTSISTPTAVPIPVTPPPTIVTAPTAVAPFAEIETTLENIYARVNPSVVNIDVVQRLDTTLPPFPDIPGFPFPGPQDQPQYTRGLGSGFIWDSAGDIVTNNHVVENAANITITFHDGTIVTAKIVGADPDSDLAVVKVDLPSGQLKPVQMGDSAQLKVGQLAIAIGNPFGLEGTMTVGIVSALGRQLPANRNSLGLTYNISDIIQTDASVNPGNSGGVLLDSAGRVIGVPSDIASMSGSSSGVGFAIPSAIVQQVVPALIKSGRYEHPYLGVTFVSMFPDIAASMGLSPGQRGALVVEVTAGAPADKAGLKAGQNEVTISGQTLSLGGDLVVAYNGKTVKSSDDLVTFLARDSVGQTVTFSVLRDGKTIQVPVTIGARPGS
jgi:S1-C subfamily serine protease